MSENGRQTEAVVRSHVDAVIRGDIPAVMADYDEDAVMIGTFGSIEGREALAAAFGGAGEMTRGLVIDHLVCTSHTALLVFHSEVIAFGVDTFVLRDGKIVSQTTASRPG